MRSEFKALVNLYTLSESARIRAVYEDTKEYEYGLPPHRIVAKRLGIPASKVKQIIAA